MTINTIAPIVRVSVGSPTLSEADCAVVVSSSVTTVSTVVACAWVVTDAAELVAGAVALVIACVVTEVPTIVIVCERFDLGTVATPGPLAGYASDGPQA